mgnify:CR=1 FL=1
MSYNIYIGFELKEQIASDICEFSLRKNSNSDLKINYLKKNELIKKGIYTRTVDKLSSTEFTFTRFLVPYLSNYKGWLICKHTHGELGLTAAIGQHLMLAIPNACDGHQQTAQNMIDDILTEKIPITSKPLWGTIDKPGIGVDVDEEKVNFYNKKFLDEGEYLPYGESF